MPFHGEEEAGLVARKNSRGIRQGGKQAEGRGGGGFCNECNHFLFPLNLKLGPVVDCKCIPPWSLIEARIGRSLTTTGQCVERVFLMICSDPNAWWRGEDRLRDYLGSSSKINAVSATLASSTLSHCYPK